MNIRQIKRAFSYFIGNYPIKNIGNYPFISLAYPYARICMKFLNIGNYPKFCFYLGVLLLPFSASAGGVGDNMESFWNDMGGATNITPGGHYEGQAAGHYSLGNVFVRNKIRNKNFASLQLPSHRAGCGGIDMFAGSFSYISADELISLFNAIGSNAGAFAFKLGLETLSPQISEQISELQKIVQEMNEFQINSCEQAASLVGGLWPQHDEASKSICSTIGNRRGLFSDYAASKHQCSSGGSRAATLNSQDGEFENIKITNVNLAWKAIKDSGLVGVGSSFDREMAELFMTLSGTIVIKAGSDDESAGSYQNIIGNASSNEVLSTLLDGGTIDVIRCDEVDSCLNPTIDGSSHTLAADKGFNERVKRTLRGLVDKVANETSAGESLSAEEMGLLNITAIPIYKIINVSSAYSGASSFFELDKYSEIIAMEFLFEYLGKIVKDLETAANQQTVGSRKDVETFRDNIENVKAALAKREITEDKKIQTLLTLVNRTAMIEQMLSGRLNSSISDNLKWSNSFK